jgi:hypothetical protein
MTRRFEIPTGVKMQVEVLYVVTPCSVVGYESFGTPCYTASQHRGPRPEVNY